MILSFMIFIIARQDLWLVFWDSYRENKWLKKSVQTTENVFVFSSHTKTEVLKYFPQVRDKISVLAPVAEELHRPTDEDARDVVRYQFTQGDAYFLYRGPVHPAANIIELLKGFSIFKKRIGSNMKLVLAGPQGEYSANILTDLESYKYRNDVLLMEHLLPVDESSIISAAYAMVHPCRHETIWHTRGQCHESRCGRAYCREQQHG